MSTSNLLINLRISDNFICHHIHYPKYMPPPYLMSYISAASLVTLSSPPRISTISASTVPHLYEITCYLQKVGHRFCLCNQTPFIRKRLCSFLFDTKSDNLGGLILYQNLLSGKKITEVSPLIISCLYFCCTHTASLLTHISTSSILIKMCLYHHACTIMSQLYHIYA